jgi:DNA-binding beta-propeller fold protein YncE
VILFYLLNVYGSRSGLDTDQERYSFVARMGSKGVNDGEFNTPHTIAFDSSGNTYVTDTKNSSVQKFDSNGTFLTKWVRRA